MTDAEQKFTLAAATRIPLRVDGDGWSLKFQTQPERKIKFDGRQPTRDEIITACGILQVYMIDVIELTIESCLREREATK
jgi:hypothetical protein